MLRLRSLAHKISIWLTYIRNPVHDKLWNSLLTGCQVKAIIELEMSWGGSFSDAGEPGLSSKVYLWGGGGVRFV